MSEVWMNLTITAAFVILLAVAISLILAPHWMGSVWDWFHRKPRVSSRTAANYILLERRVRLLEHREFELRMHPNCNCTPWPVTLTPKPRGYGIVEDRT